MYIYIYVGVCVSCIHSHSVGPQWMRINVLCLACERVDQPDDILESRSSKCPPGARHGNLPRTAIVKKVHFYNKVETKTRLIRDGISKLYFGFA